MKLAWLRRVALIGVQSTVFAGLPAKARASAGAAWWPSSASPARC